ncbi:hypothetical protein HNR27_001149 [Ornithinibacillus bavariensis]
MRQSILHIRKIMYMLLHWEHILGTCFFIVYRINIALMLVKSDINKKITDFKDAPFKSVILTINFD